MALVSKAEAMDMEIIKEPYLARLRNEVTGLQGIVDTAPDELGVTRAWASVSKVIEALKGTLAEQSCDMAWGQQRLGLGCRVD
jgi:hypothetical protein